MTSRKIPLLHITGVHLQGTIIPAAELTRCTQALETLQAAQHKARALKEEAQEALVNAQNEAELIRQQARLEGQKEGEQWIEKARTQAINETVTWLVEEDDLELTIANRLEEHIRSLASQALLEFAGKQDPAELLVRRLARKVPETIREGQALQIKVHAWDLATVQAAFHDQTRIQVSADDKLTPGQAILENDLVTVRIDLDAHLNVLIQRLKAPPRFQSPA